MGKHYRRKGPAPIYEEDLSCWISHKVSSVMKPFELVPALIGQTVGTYFTEDL